MRQHVSVLRARLGFGILLTGVVAALLMQAWVIGQVNSKNNATRCAVVGLVAKLSLNSERNARAILAAPDATPEQKAVARKNLAVLQDTNRTTAELLDHPHGARCDLSMIDSATSTSVSSRP